MAPTRWVPWLFALALSWFVARPAQAGSCEGYHREAVREFEVYAAKGRPTPSADEICLDDLRSEPKLAARVVKACDAIVRREPGFAPCVAWSVRYGAKALGGLDLFEAIGRLFPMQVFTYQDPALELYAALGDPRAVPVVRAAWQAAAADPRSGKKKHAHVWGVWRRVATDFFAVRGGADERAFLQAQLATTTARGLRKAMTKAIAAIERRVAAPAPAP